MAVSIRQKGWGVAAAAALVALALFVAFFDWNWLRKPIAHRVSAMVGREFRIDGNLGVDWGWSPKIHAEGLHLANASWSEQREMASVERVEAQIRILPLLIGRIDLNSLVADKPRLLIERSNKGAGNWDFSPKTDTRKKAATGLGPRIRQLQVTDGALRYRDPLLKSSLQLAVNSTKPRNSGGIAPLQLTGDGTYRDAPFELSGTVDSPLDLRDDSKPYRIDLRARAGDTHSHISGRLVEPLQIDDVSVNFELQGANLADLYELVGVPLPPTPPYELAGKLSRKGSHYAYHDFKGRIGDSDMAGDADLTFNGKRPRLAARLKSGRLDFDDLATLIGGTPSTAEGETASSQQVQEKAAIKAAGRVLPARPFRLEKLRIMDADVTLTAEQIDAPKLPLESMTAHLKLDNGVLHLDPLDFNAAGGVLKTNISLDARGDPINTAARIDIRGMDLSKLMPTVKSLKGSIGGISGAIKLTGEGNSVAAMLATSNGNLSVIMGQGEMSNLLLEFAGLDIAESLKFLLGKDHTVKIRCAYADFGVAEGKATINSFAFDTTDTVVRARGSFDFKDESLDMTLQPRPKDFSPVTLRSPLAVGGHFADPSFIPKPLPLLLRAGAAVALASIAPPVALLALIETGPGKSVDCGKAVELSQAAKQ
ncbi:MAG: AsmA family protein [Pseudomonadota bacterium]